MAKYLISFPSAAMVVPDGELEAVARDAHAVIDAAKAAGVYVFGGGIDEGVPPALVSADGSVAEGGYPWAPPLDGGLTVLECPRARRPSPGPRALRRPVGASRSYACSGSTRGREGGAGMAQELRPKCSVKPTPFVGADGLRRWAGLAP